MDQCTSEGCDREAIVDLLRVADASLRRKCRKCADELVSIWPTEWRLSEVRWEERAPAG